MKYIRLLIENTEPLCISNDASSQSGQTDCIRYIPGTTLRGYVISSIAKDGEFFEKYKKELFSRKVSFLNGYPCSYENGKVQELIPSLKGFYETKKADGPVKNVCINGEFDEGMKRANLGRFCRINGSQIDCYQIDTDSGLKIQINYGEQKVFRGEYILPGYTFASYIALDDVDAELEDRILKCFTDKQVILGNGRSQGYGKCKTKVSGCDMPELYSGSEGSDKTDYVYMILLSGLAMRGDNGEYCGLNLKSLEKDLGVSDLKVEQCSTSMITVHGYNSTWGTKLPTMPVYEQGSVFKLSFTGTLTADKIRKLYDNGIGERRTEGFGRILLLGSEYEKVNFKNKKEIGYGEEGCDHSLSECDKKVVKIIAGKYYRNQLMSAIQKKIPEDASKMKITPSQSGNVLSILEKERYNPNVSDVLKNYFDHAAKKEEDRKIQKERESIGGFAKNVMTILSNEDFGKYLGIEKTSVMNIPVTDLLDKEEIMELKVSYVSDLIKYAGKEK